MVDIDKLFALYKDFPEPAAANVVFNELMLTEYRTWLTPEIIDAFVSRYPYVKLNFMGLQELYSRDAIYDHLVKIGAVPDYVREARNEFGK